MIAWRASHSVHLIYAVVVLIGVVRAFNAPVSRALLPQLVPGEHFPNAVAWNASIFQAATILGPSVGGLPLRFSRGPSVVYVTATVTAIAAIFSTLRITLQTQARAREPVTWTTVLAGFRYIWEHKLVLGSISLDMFAVLLGGAVALLAGLRQRNSQDRTVGTGPAAQRSGRRSGGHGDSCSPSSAAAPRRTDHVVLRGRFWRVHHYLRSFTQPGAFAGVFAVARRHRHGQRHRAVHPGAVMQPRTKCADGLMPST